MNTQTINNLPSRDFSNDVTLSSFIAANGKITKYLKVKVNEEDRAKLVLATGKEVLICKRDSEQVFAGKKLNMSTMFVNEYTNDNGQTGWNAYSKTPTGEEIGGFFA